MGTSLSGTTSRIMIIVKIHEGKCSQVERLKVFSGGSILIHFSNFPWAKKTSYVLTSKPYIDGLKNVCTISSYLCRWFLLQVHTLARSHSHPHRKTRYMRASTINPNGAPHALEIALTYSLNDIHSYTVV